jgi:hypothetical protein
MRIAYVTIDLVNERTAQNLAEGCGASLHGLTPRDPPPGADCDAVLYDLDSLPPQLGQQILADLLAAPARRRLAVHSYNLEDRQIIALREHGVGVYRSVEPAVLQSLRRVGAATCDGTLPEPAVETTPEVTRERA